MVSIHWHEGGERRGVCERREVCGIAVVETRYYERRQSGFTTSGDATDGDEKTL